MRERESRHLSAPFELARATIDCHSVVVSANGAIYSQARRADARIKHDGICPAMNLAPLRKRLEPVLRGFFHLYWRFARGLTMGVRAVVIDSEGRVFLVKHTYVAGWQLPGGGVEVGETVLDALKRELIEEGRIEVLDEPQLHGLFFNVHVSHRDHVVIFVVRKFHQDRMPAPNREIAACGFFAPDELPEDTTGGTRLRIAEVLDGKTPIETWR
jgi:8-oxo-dGTP pyrophosphatase MutT (NUDIX family)